MPPVLQPQSGTVTLEQYEALTEEKRVEVPFDVKLADNPLTIVQPDLMIVCDKSKLDGKRCNGAPDFVIEIISPSNPADDYIRKLYYYQNYGNLHHSGQN